MASNFLTTLKETYDPHSLLVTNISARSFTTLSAACGIEVEPELSNHLMETALNQSHIDPAFAKLGHAAKTKEILEVASLARASFGKNKFDLKHHIDLIVDPGDETYGPHISIHREQADKNIIAEVELSDLYDLSLNPFKKQWRMIATILEEMGLATDGGIQGTTVETVHGPRTAFQLAPGIQLLMEPRIVEDSPEPVPLEFHAKRGVSFPLVALTPHKISNLFKWLDLQNLNGTKDSMVDFVQRLIGHDLNLKRVNGAIFDRGLHTADSTINLSWSVVHRSSNKPIDINRQEERDARRRARLERIANSFIDNSTIAASVTGLVSRFGPFKLSIRIGNPEDPDKLNQPALRIELEERSAELLDEVKRFKAEMNR